MKKLPLSQNKKDGDYSSKRRINTIILAIVLFMVYFIVELFRTTIIKNDYYLALAKNQQIITSNISPKRGSIYTSDLIENDQKALAAQSIERFALTVTPKNVPKKYFNKIASVFDDYIEDLSQEQIIQIFSKDTMYTPPLKHGLTKHEVQDIAKKIDPKVDINFDDETGDILYFTKGIIFIREFYRYYPEKSLASHALGFVDKENNGKYGIEGYFDSELKGKSGSIALERDNTGELLDEVGEVKRQNGVNIVLTIDRNVQFFVEEKLKKALETYGAQSGIVIVMEPKTGAIMAMSAMPDYDPNDYRQTDYKNFLNPVINTQYEAGSVMKAFTVSAGLDLGLITPETKNNYPGTLAVGSYVIHNVGDKSYDNQTISGILENSINTGTIWIANKLGNNNFYSYLTNFGFGQKTGIELPGEITGDLPDVSKWKDIHRSTISFGQGIAITPMQLITGYSAIANGGTLMKPFLIKEKINSDGKLIKYEPKEVRRVINQETAKKVNKMFQNVVEIGHAKHAQIPGYSIGGKTGTAQIPLPTGGYSDVDTYHTFVGIGPITDPKFVIAVILNKPKALYADSTTVYVFNDIARYLLNYWQIPPDKK